MRLPIEKPFVTFVTLVVKSSSVSAELYGTLPTRTHSYSPRPVNAW
jgi:hypothetical protein